MDQSLTEQIEYLERSLKLFEGENKRLQEARNEHHEMEDRLRYAIDEKKAVEEERDKLS